MAQSEVYEILKESGKWMTTTEIAKIMKTNNLIRINTALRKLRRSYQEIQMRQKTGTLKGEQEHKYFK